MDELARQIRTYYEATTTATAFEARSARPASLMRAVPVNESSRRSEPDPDRRDKEAIMLTLEERPQTELRRRSRGPWLAAAAAVLALVGGIVTIAVIRHDDGNVPASVVAMTVADEFMAARNAWDVPATQALLADGVDADYFGAPEFERATGVQFDNAVCTATTTETPIAVTCTYQMRNAWSDALGTGPFDGAFRLTIGDGVVTSATNDFPFDTNGFSPGAWEPFYDWVASTHPDDVDVMYTDNGTDIETTPDALTLWAARTTEFVDSQPTTTGSQ